MLLMLKLELMMLLMKLVLICLYFEEAGVDGVDAEADDVYLEVGADVETCADGVDVELTGPVKKWQIIL